LQALKANIAVTANVDKDIREEMGVTEREKRNCFTSSRALSKPAGQVLFEKLLLL
jgi:hypothetical protein